MENRFGVKDFFIFILLAAIIVMVAMAMTQFDRQYDRVVQIQRQNEGLTRDIVALNRRLDEVAVSPVEGSGRGAGGGQTPPSRMKVFQPLVEAEKKPDFARGDWLVDNFGTKIGRLTPLVSTDVYQTWVESRVVEGMATRDPETLEWIPQLAESWDVKDFTPAWEAYVKPLREKGMDEKQIDEQLRKDPKAPTAAEFVFRLRRNVTFSDAVPFTADDVKFTFDWVMNAEVNAPRVRAYLDNLKAVTVLGPHEVSFTFTKPYFKSFETTASMPVLSKAFYSRFKPQEFNERTGLLIGTGPYKMVDPENWAPGKPVELLRNERYWGIPPTFNKMVFREIEDESAEMVTFLNGELDLFTCVPDQYEKMLKDERVMKIAKNFKYPTPLRGYMYLGWNQVRKSDDDKETPTPFRDRRVRLAMTHLIDRERIVKDVMLGHGTVASGPFFPDGPQANTAIKPWPYDEKRGKALLAEAGFVDRDGDGNVEGPDGRPFRFKIMYPSGNATYNRLVLFLKDNFARAGITMEPDPTEWSVMLDRVKRSQFDACALGWGGVIETDPYQIFHSSQIKDQGDNRTNYVNPELDALIDKARLTVDDPARMKLWHEVHRILHEDQPYTFMIARPELEFVSNRIANIKTTKLGFNYLRLFPNPSPWYVPKAQQKYVRD